MIYIQEQHILAPYCTYQIGGPADFFVEVKNTDELEEAVNWADMRDMPYFVFGGGSNLLFDDAGFRGLVIRMKDESLEVDGERIHAGAGAKAAMVVNAALEAGLTGLESWNGLPGTVGGAVYGNAGCFGIETKDVVEEVTLLIPGEGVKTVSKDYFNFEYRRSRLKDKPGVVVLKAIFKLEAGERGEIKEKMMEIAKSRIGKQPAGLSTGSFFKNPSPEQSAGFLIDKAGLKGKSVGGAAVSDQHGNFFMNKGGATAKDVIDLGELVAKEVKEQFGVELERELVFVLAG